MPYVGNPLANAFSSREKQDLTGQSGTSFTLTHSVSHANDLSVYINHVRQEPTTAYSVNGTTLTTTGSVAGTDDFYIIYDELAVQSISHPTDQALTATSGTFTSGLVGTTAVFSGAISGTLGTAAQPNITSVGTLTGLTTSGDIDVQGNDIILDADNDTSIVASTDDQIDFKAGNVIRASVNTTGLQIGGTTYFASPTLTFFDPDSGVGASTVGGRIHFHTNDGTAQGVSAKIQAKYEDTNGNTAITFDTGSGGSTAERMRIASNGSVGINTSSPNTNYQAHIYNAAAGSGLLVQGLGAGREAYVTIQGETSGGSTRTALFKVDNSDKIRLACAQATEWTIESGDVAGYRMKSDRQQIISYSGDQNPGNNQAILTLGYNLGSNKGGLFMPTYSYYSDIFFEVRNNDTNNGRVHDDIYFRRNGTRHGGIRIVGGSGVSYDSISDYREKTDEKAINDAIGTVKKLKPYNFKWKKSGIRQDGFFAHEVDEVLDYAVSGKKDATTNYENVVLNNKGEIIASGVLKEDFDKRLIDGEDDEASPKGETTYPEGSTWKATHEDIDPQGLDPAKLVPILTAALQEAIKRIEVLESK